MYNAHRGLVPQPNNRLSELLDQVRAEFDNQAGRAGDYEHQSESSLIISIAYCMATVSSLSFIMLYSHVNCVMRDLAVSILE
jgi:hypothetical protein